MRIRTLSQATAMGLWARPLAATEIASAIRAKGEGATVTLWESFGQLPGRGECFTPHTFRLAADGQSVECVTRDRQVILRYVLDPQVGNSRPSRMLVR